MKLVSPYSTIKMHGPINIRLKNLKYVSTRALGFKKGTADITGW